MGITRVTHDTYTVCRHVVATTFVIDLGNTKTATSVAYNTSGSKLVNRKREYPPVGIRKSSAH